MRAQPAERVVLYVREGCHLCETARATVAEVASEAGTAVLEVDIDRGGAGETSERLVERYGELVPVVTVDGVQQGYWRLDAARLRRALSGGQG